MRRIKEIAWSNFKEGAFGITKEEQDQLFKAWQDRNEITIHTLSPKAIGWGLMRLISDSAIRGTLVVEGIVNYDKAVKEGSINDKGWRHITFKEAETIVHAHRKRRTI